jgi:hypothetical protein
MHITVEYTRTVRDEKARGGGMLCVATVKNLVFSCPRILPLNCPLYWMSKAVPSVYYSQTSAPE